MADQEFFIRGDTYVVLIASGQRLVPVADGKLVALHYGADEIVSAVEIELQASSGVRRAYVPIGPGVVVKRAALEPVEQPPEPFRVPGQAIALVVPEVGESEFGDPEPVAWHIPQVGPSAAVVLVHSHRQMPTGRLAHGATVAHEHEHVLLAFEDPRHPLHTHDDAHGLTPIYGQGPLRRASLAAARERSQS